MFGHLRLKRHLSLVFTIDLPNCGNDKTQASLGLPWSPAIDWMIVDKGILGDRKSVAMTTAAQQFSNFGDDSRKNTKIPKSKVQGTPRSKSKFVCLVSIFCFMLSTVKKSFHANSKNRGYLHSHNSKRISVTFFWGFMHIGHT